MEGVPIPWHDNKKDRSRHKYEETEAEGTSGMGSKIHPKSEAEEENESRGATLEDDVSPTHRHLLVYSQRCVAPLSHRPTPAAVWASSSVQQIYRP